MDNTNKILEDKPQPSLTNPSGGGVSSVQKERAPISSIAASEAPSVPTEVREAGVERVTGEMPPLTPEHKAVGREHTGESVQVDTKKILRAGQLPTTEEVKENLMQPLSNSGRWWAELAKKILNRFRLWKEGK